MVSLILVIVSIALMAAMLAATMPVISVDAVTRQSLQKDTDYGLHLLEFGVIRYLDAHRNAEGNIVYPGDGVNLKAALYPMYGFVPADVRNELTWDVTTGTLAGQPAVGICVYPKGVVTDIQRHVLANIQRTLPLGSAYQANACRATSNSSDGAALTYWVIVAHVN